MGKVKLLDEEGTRCDVRDWLNFQVVILLAICIASVLAACGIIVMTLACDGDIYLRIHNGTLVCGTSTNQHLKDIQSTISPTDNKEKNSKSSSYSFNQEEPEWESVENHSLGSMMRIILVLIVVAIVIIVTIISMHKVLLREKHKRLTGELEKLMEVNGVNPNSLLTMETSSVSNQRLPYDSIVDGTSPNQELNSEPGQIV